MNVYPGATVIRGSAGQYVGGPFRGVLHTTEGPEAAGAISVFQNEGYWPHLTYTYETGRPQVFQHLDLATEAGAALEHRGGTVQTNNQSAIQIEIVGYAATSHSWSDGILAGLAALMRWIEAQVGVHPVSTVKWSATDVGDAVRLSESQWLAYQGWCGHAHVCNQLHWDPGKPDISKLLPKPVGVVVNGLHLACPCFIDAGTTWVEVRAICGALRLAYTVQAGSKMITIGGPAPIPKRQIALRLVGNTGYVAAHDLPVKVAYDAVQNLLRVTTT